MAHGNDGDDDDDDDGNDDEWNGDDERDDDDDGGDAEWDGSDDNFSELGLGAACFHSIATFTRSQLRELMLDTNMNKYK